MNLEINENRVLITGASREIRAATTQIFGAPKEVADAAVFLYSERTNFITESVLVIDGSQIIGMY